MPTRNTNSIHSSIYVRCVCVCVYVSHHHIDTAHLYFGNRFEGRFVGFCFEYDTVNLMAQHKGKMFTYIYVV